MRRTGTQNRGDFVDAEAIGCGIGLLIGISLSAALVAFLSS